MPAPIGHRITIRRPDDWHLHVRDGEVLSSVVPATARVFRRAIIMPNLKPPVRTVQEAEAYHHRIKSVLPVATDFEPLMTLYLTDETSQTEIHTASESAIIAGCKLYPAGATTNSDAGVTSLDSLYPVFEAMERHDLVLQIHGEETGSDVDIFDREARFLEQSLRPIVDRFPALRIVFEHITTREAAQFVESAREGVGATITPQHLMLNRNALLVGGIRPHNYCLPILKREEHRQELERVAVSRSPRFFLGTDSAPHARHTKENDCGCAGVYSAPIAIELYAEFFDHADALDRLEAFASLNGPRFYKLPENESSITLEKRGTAVPGEYSFGESTVVPFRAGQKVEWAVVE